MPTTYFQTQHLSKKAGRWSKRLGLGLLVGVIAGLAASLMEWGVDQASERIVGRFTHLGGAEVFHFEWAILLFPAIGGLIAGLWVHFLAPNSRGHGIDALTRAFHNGLGRLPIKGAAVKCSGTVVVMGTGGSAGPEGTIAALGAAIGSITGRLFNLTPQEKRVLLLAGCAAGIGAIFRCPLGGALFATGIIYREPEFESDAIVSAFVASVAGYTTFMALLGYEGPFLEGIESLRFISASDLVWYAILGPMCGLVSIFFALTLKCIENKLVPKTKLPIWLLPAIGGLGTGALACVVPQVMDGRYMFLQNAVSGELFNLALSEHSYWEWAMFFALIVVTKCIATALTVGSGAPGGVLGPAVFIGGVVGCTVGMVGKALFPETFSPQLQIALIPVGMAGVLAATMREPLAAIVMTTEMTGSYGLIAPLMLVCVTSYVIGRRWGVNDEQVPTSADSPAHAADAVLHMLQSVHVSQVAEKTWPLTIDPDTGLDEVIEQIEPGTRPIIAVARDGQLLGLITTTDLSRVLATPGVSAMLVASEVMTKRIEWVEPDDNLYNALNAFNTFGHEVLPVLDQPQTIGWLEKLPNWTQKLFNPTASRQPVWHGMLTRRGVAEAMRQQMNNHRRMVLEEHQDLSSIEQDMRVEQLLMAMPSHDLSIQRLFVPIDAVGKTLLETSFRKRYGVEVIAIEKRDGSIQCPPDVQEPLQTDQRLLVVRHQDAS